MTLREVAVVPIQELVDQMNHKLEVHKTKGHWLNDDEDTLVFYRRFHDEVREFDSAMMDWFLDQTPENWVKVEHEMGDIGNFMMMMIDVARTKQYPELRGQNG